MTKLSRSDTQLLMIIVDGSICTQQHQQEGIGIVWPAIQWRISYCVLDDR